MEEYKEWFNYIDKVKPEYYSKFQKSKNIIISDCDGILTDSHSIYSKNGKEYKIYGAYDKEMLQFMKYYNFKFIFVSDDLSGFEITKRRLDEWTDTQCKLINVNYEERYNLVLKYKNLGYNVFFIGDSISDIYAGEQANLFLTVKNASPIVKIYAKFIGENGGEGGFASCLQYIYFKAKKELKL